MRDSEDYEITDVLICGCGPTGAMLSAYLGQMGTQNVVLEKEAEITTDPRGIALDEDGIRLLQGIGIYDSIYTEIGSCMNSFKFIGGRKKVLDKPAFTEMDYSTTEGGTGHVGFICHKQPTLEKHLRKSMMKTHFSDLRTKCTVEHIAEDENWVYCAYRDQEGKSHRIKARFLVGADGKTGFTRKNYLEPLGIHMEQAHSAFYDETWVALNWEIILPNPKTHPSFPLWKLGYTPEQVYDLFFPVNFRFICNPDRPAVCGRFGLPSDRLWRFEFVVLPNEDPEEMSQSEMIRKVVFPYLTHGRNRYGISQDIEYPEDCIRVLRSRPFRFSARSCNRWSRGRVVLCGDSAHVFPPFGGQGIASGFRDAVSLHWRLALLCRKSPSEASSHESILEGWYRERKQQLERSLAATINNGRFVTERNVFKIFWRTIVLFFMNLYPYGRREIRLGQRKDGLVRYKYTEGLPFLPEHDGGLCLPQIYCKTVNKKAQQIKFTDDVIFSTKSDKLFRLVIYLQQVEELVEAERAVSNIYACSKGHILLEDTKVLVEQEITSLPNTSVIDAGSIFQLATAREFSGSSLCKNRPEPRFYDPIYMKKALKGKKFVIIRPDRFIFAACDSKEDLEDAASRAAELLDM